jgi:hypothetical protein
MKHQLPAPRSNVAAFGLGIFLCLAAPASAQSPVPLPTAPGADRAVSGGLTQAPASLPGGPGSSPLEPYLVLWLLPVSGVLTLLAGRLVDIGVQRRAAQRPGTSVRPSGRA